MPDGHLEDPFVWLKLDDPGTPPVSEAVPVFDENAYLCAFPDVARAIHAGRWTSARHHYEKHGCAELRLQDRRYLTACNALSAEPSNPTPDTIAGSIDVVFTTASGMCLVIGWVDDVHAPIVDIALKDGTAILGYTRFFARCRRTDAEESLGGRGAHLLGFWAILRIRTGRGLGRSVTAEVRTEASALTFTLTPNAVSDARLRELVFSYLADAKYFGNPQIESFIQLERGIGQELTAYNADISRGIIAGAYVARFGPQARSFAGSIVVCLYGKSEFLFLQAALFTSRGAVEDYEFIYVSNSPDLAERLQREATIAAQIYGVAITLVILPDNAGFGAANNVAAQHARSPRILIVNPDVFPREADWASVHSGIVQSRPPNEVRVFGVPLYYDDGSLMHGGFHYEMDEAWSIRTTGVERRRLARVEHLGKGASADPGQFQEARPVPGVTGAFISVARDWFEKLDGFSLEFVFGHYEDADFCLKSLEAGQEVWMQDVPFWHLEGKGSTRLPLHEGGSTVNRWHFTSRWGPTLENGLLGKSPVRLGRG